MKYSRQDFPVDFLFGAATSAYQIEGHKYGGAGRTHWDDFAATPGNVSGAEDGALACDHFHRFAGDLDLVQVAGFDSYRFSTSWARVLPKGRGQANEAGLDYYDRLVDAMLARRLKPFLTLYHWELPSALADLGGWRNRDIVNWFAEYVDVLVRRIGDRIWAAAPINEPWCVSWLSHFYGQHAPGVRDIRATARVAHHILLAHGRAISVMRSHGMGNLGAIFNHEWVTAADNSVANRKAADLYDSYYNRFFIAAVFKQHYPKNVLAGLEPHLPVNWQDDFTEIGVPVDWCGLNYYTRKIIAANNQPWPALEEVAGNLEKTAMDWEIYPRGLFNFITRTHTEYTGGIPIYITENGMANHDVIDKGKISDQARINYLNDHLAEVLRAIKAGIPVRGYFIWSLLDNFEWSLGYAKRFGLVHVDFTTQQRTPKASYIAVRNALTLAK